MCVVLTFFNGFVDILYLKIVAIEF